MQVADRFHLVRNLGEALETFLLHKRGVLKEAAARVTEVLVPAALPLPESAAMYTGKRKTPRPRLWQQRVEEASLQRHARVVAAYERVHALRAKGADIGDIARTVGVGRRTVYRYLHLAGPPERKRPGQRPSPHRAAWEAFISHRWEEGCHNGRQLWREARAAGHRCSDSSVARFVADLRRLGPQRVTARRTGGAITSVQGPTARRVALLLLRPPENRTPEQALYVEHLCQYEATIATAHALVQTFMRMLHERQGAYLDAWVEAVAQSGIAELHRFAQGLAKDHAAVQAGLSVAYSNGQTEGQIHRLNSVS